MALKHTILALIVLAAVAAAVAVAVRPDTTNTMRTILIGSTKVAVDVADTESLREQGLSGRAGLAEGEGMLFVFERDGLWAFWMKDMLFPLDMIWADAEGRVVTVAADVSPDTYPQTFAPSAPALYVLEVPAGFAAQHGVALGTKLVI
ncbi:DUF192 domain-containing protein [Candidatus Kaiserbacteria bacterium]|nr:DUF192 domain-containing protein [Candidatus Kaiserbacteria bacterium]